MEIFLTWTLISADRGGGGGKKTEEKSLFVVVLGTFHPGGVRAIGAANNKPVPEFFF